MGFRPQTAFGDAVDALLKERHLSVRQFAKLVGMPSCSVSESKRSALNPKHFDRWADALELAGERRQEFIDLAWMEHAPQPVLKMIDHLRQENERLRADNQALRLNRTGSNSKKSR